jgi:hypothetical protein
LSAAAAGGNSETISKRGFAELIGVTPGRVSQLITAGLPVEPSGRINSDRGKAWVRDNVDQNRRRSQLDGAPPVVPLTAKASKEVADAAISNLKAGRLARNLIDRKATLRTIEARARFERDSWIGWVNRAAPEIARATNADIGTVVATLDRMVREHLSAMASTPLEISASDASEP